MMWYQCPVQKQTNQAVQINKGYAWTRSCTASSLHGFDILSSCPGARQIVCLCCHLASGKECFSWLLLDYYVGISAESWCKQLSAALQQSQCSLKLAPARPSIHLAVWPSPTWVQSSDHTELYCQQRQYHLLQKYVRPLRKTKSFHLVPTPLQLSLEGAFDIRALP